MARHCEDRACRCELVSAREPPPQRRRPERTQLTARIPPPAVVHLADAGHNQAKLQQPLKVDQPGPPRPELLGIQQVPEGLRRGPRYSEFQAPVPSLRGWGPARGWFSPAGAP